MLEDRREFAEQKEPSHQYELPLLKLTQYFPVAEEELLWVVLVKGIWSWVVVWELEGSLGEICHYFGGQQRQNLLQTEIYKQWRSVEKLGSILERQTYRNPYLGFSGFLTSISNPILQNFLGRFEGSNQGLNTASSVELLGPVQISRRETLTAIGH